MSTTHNPPFYFSVRNWSRFQHYKNRDPLWLKLYRDLLTSETWVLGSDLSRVVQIASILLAPRYNNSIPYRFDLLQRVMSLNCDEAALFVAIQELIDNKFIEIQEVSDTENPVVQVASKRIAKCSLERERDKDKEGEREGEAMRPPAIGTLANGYQASVPRGTSAAVIPCGDNLTRSAEDILDGMMDDWRRDVPEANQPKCAEWFKHLEGRGKRMGPNQRLFQARQLSKAGDEDAQAEIVDFCIGQGYATLIPLADVRRRTHSVYVGRGVYVPRKTVAQLEAEEAASAGK